ncbi:MAG: hypothetical protein RL071_454 [Pseudomonadota bacterium]
MLRSTLPFLLAALACGATPAHAEEGRLHPREVTASSALQSSWAQFQENYQPNYVADDNPATAWVEGVAGDGVGERLTLQVGPARGATAVTVRLRPGYQKSEGLLKANAAPKRVRIDARNATGVVATGELSLPRAMGWQELRLDLPADSTLSAVEITILEVHPGSKYADTCVSDVAVVLSSTEPYRASIENARQQAILRWIESRRAMAAAYAAAPKAYPFASQEFTEQKLPDPTPAQLALVRAAAKETDALLAEGAGWRPTRKQPPAPLPDRLFALENVQDMLLAAETSYFETRDAWVKVEREGSEAEGWTNESKRGAAHIRWHDQPGGAPQAVAWRHHASGDERMRWANDTKLLVRYDAAGRATSVYMHTKEGGEFNELVDELVQIEWSGDGKLKAVDYIELREHLNIDEGKPGRKTAGATRYAASSAPSSP